MNEFREKTLLDVKWKVVRPVRSNYLAIMPESWDCNCSKNKSYKEIGCSCHVGKSITLFGLKKGDIAEYIVHIHNERLDIKCDNHPSQRATIYATPDIELNSPQRLCMTCVGNIMETPHYKDVWFWNMDGTGEKWLSAGTINEKEEK